MIRLGVNVDHVATVRQARRGRSPSVVAAAHAALLGGADHVVMHLREDRRHVQDADVEVVRAALDAPLALEMAATPEMVGVACRVKPDQACLVPERREELTTEGGLDVVRHRDAVRQAIDKLHAAEVQVSVFVDPEEQALLAANEVGADAVELHTGRYADANTEARRVHEYSALRRAAAAAKQLGLRVHAGHGLDYLNVGLVAAIPDVEELNIGFAIIGRALFVGMSAAVREMRELLGRARELSASGEA